MDSGEKTIQFSQCHRNMEITAMAFDTTGRRLVTGGRDGSLKIWNFNNGACLRVLDTRYSVEVCVCVCVCVFVCGDMCVCVCVRVEGVLYSTYCIPTSSRICNTILLYP